MKEKIKNLREKYLPYDEQTLRRLTLSATVMLAFILIWALVFKLGSEIMLVRNYTNLKDMTIEERIMWDIIPFNYSPIKGTFASLFMDTVLNCFAFAPLGVLLCYVFKKRSILRNAAICLGFSVLVEALQLATMLGNPATEDLITNTAGALIGYGLYHLIFKRISTKNSIRIAAAANAIFAIISVFAAITLSLASETVWGIITRTL